LFDKEDLIKPCIPLHGAYEVGAATQQTVRSPRTTYPHSQEWHRNREAAVYLRRRHPNKPSRWVKAKYFERRRDRDWTFLGETCDDEGWPNKVWLYYAKSTPIKRQVKVKGEANPHDPA